MSTPIAQLRARPGCRSPQSNALAWDAAPQPSGRRTATRRAAAEYELVVRRWLLDLARS
jgi:hypothetical protein